MMVEKVSADCNNQFNLTSNASKIRERIELKKNKNTVSFHNFYESALDQIT